MNSKVLLLLMPIIHFLPATKNITKNGTPSIISPTPSIINFIKNFNLKQQNYERHFTTTRRAYMFCPLF